MASSTLITQWSALVWKNFLITRRNYYQLVMVFLFPLMTSYYILRNGLPPNDNADAKNEIHFTLPFTYAGPLSLFKRETFHLCVAPENLEKKFLYSIEKSLSIYLLGSVEITSFEDENSLNEELVKTSQDNRTDCNAGIVFLGNVSADGSYIIRVPDDGCSTAPAHICFTTNFGVFSSTQQSIDTALLQEWLGNSKFKLPSSKIRGFLNPKEALKRTVLRVLKFFLISMVFPIVLVVTENVIYEKNMKIKEGMQLMGMKPAAYWLAWTFCEMQILTFIMCIISPEFYISHLCSFKAIVLHFFLWFGFGSSIVAFSMTVTRFCNKAPIANTVVVLFLLSAFAADIVGTSQVSSRNLNFSYYVFMLLSPVAYERGFNMVMKEQDSDGIIAALSLVFIDCILYSGVDFLLEYLYPYGFTIPWAKLKFTKEKSPKPEESDDDYEIECIDLLPHVSETGPCIKMEGIRKSFTSCSKANTVVLDGVSLEIFKGEVTCLLGANGAGKSTLMKIISRALPPDDGKVTSETSVNLGVCPQENILCDDLNSYEHLYFFGKLKGVPDLELKSKVMNLLGDFGLLRNRDKKTKILSGGQKRKLCVAIAIIGDPEVLLLDEPSSGMSPHSRRQLWNMLRDYTTTGRSVLFTTHYMDEAELLSDRIALLNYGKLKCYGTTANIKKQFGGGYNIRVSLDSDASLFCKSELVSQLMSLPVKPKIKFTSDTELVAKLPSFDAAHCVEFFKKIEDTSQEIGCDSVSISVSALEEIFSQIAAERSEESSETEANMTTPVSLSESEIQNSKNAYNISYMRNFVILLRYRIRLLLRSSYTIFPILSPIIILYLNASFSRPAQSIIQLSTEFYKNDIIHVVNLTGNPLDLFEKSASSLDVDFVFREKNESAQDKSLITANIRTFEFLNGKLDVNWSWDISLIHMHSLPIVQNLISNLIWKTWNDSTGRVLTTSTQPFKKLDLKPHFMKSTDFVVLLQISFCIIFVAFVVGMQIVKEKEKKIVWLVSCTRNNCITYWCSTFIGHFALCAFALLCIFITADLVQLKFFTENPSVKITVWIAYILCLPGCLISVYLLGRCFKTFKSADIGMSFLMLLVPLILFVPFYIAKLNDIFDPQILNCVICFLIPIYSPFGFLILLGKESATDVSKSSRLTWIIFCFVILPVSFLLYALLLLKLETRKSASRKKGVHILKEEANADETGTSKSSIVLKSVKKVYIDNMCSRKKNAKVAIQNLSMSFKEGEIFALMGSNGAGKSTLMKILSHNTDLTFGEVSFREKYKKSISFCSEENILWPNMSVKEHMHLFAILNGVPVDSVNDVINSLISDLGMTKHVQKKAQELSGGFQRKLCISLSLLGKSNLLLLDEPTTGMDPVSKQRLWKRIHNEFPSKTDRTLIFTTHSSNEAEVHCSRIGLFLDGVLRCLGTSEELKKEFSKGYELKIKLTQVATETFKDLVTKEIPDAIDKCQRGTTVEFYIPKQAFKSMSDLFASVVKIQNFKEVEDCFINECSLDQIILGLLEDEAAAHPEDPDNAV